MIGRIGPITMSAKTDSNPRPICLLSTPGRLWVHHGDSSYLRGARLAVLWDSEVGGLGLPGTVGFWSGAKEKKNRAPGGSAEKTALAGAVETMIRNLSTVEWRDAIGRRGAFRVRARVFADLAKALNLSPRRASALVEEGRFGIVPTTAWTGLHKFLGAAACAMNAKVKAGRKEKSRAREKR